MNQFNDCWFGLAEHLSLSQTPRCEALPDGAPGPDCFDCGAFLWAFLVACPFQGTQSHEGLVQMICLCKWVIFTVGEPC